LEAEAVSETVVVLGASPYPDRYSHRAVRQLLAHDHRVIPVHPAADEILGIPVVRDLASIEDTVDTVTVYIRPEILDRMLQELIDLRPKRVIFNPGTEDRRLMESLKLPGLRVIEACTLVMLNTGQF
jgi:predicted CoA-binding protein